MQDALTFSFGWWGHPRTLPNTEHKTDSSWRCVHGSWSQPAAEADRFRISDRPHALDVDSSCTSMPVEAAEEPASSETEVVGSPSTMPEDVEPRDTTQERLQALERSLCLLQDKGGEGNISVSRVAEAMKCIGIHYKYDDLAAELLSNDTDGDGSMEVHEFTGFLKQDAELERSGVTDPPEPWSVGRSLALDALPLAARAFSAHATVQDVMIRNGLRPARSGTQRRKKSLQSSRPFSADPQSVVEPESPAPPAPPPQPEASPTPSTGAHHPRPTLLQTPGTGVGGGDEEPEREWSREYIIFTETSDMFEEYASMRADYERNWQVRRKPPPAWERYSPLDLSASLSSSLRRTVSSNGALLLHDQPLHASSFTSLPTTTSSPKPVNSSSTRLVVGPDGSVLHELTDAHQELAQYSLADSQRRLIGLPSGNVARTKLAVRRAVGARVADAVKQQALQQQQLQRRQLQLQQQQQQQQLSLQQRHSQSQAWQSAAPRFRLRPAANAGSGRSRADGARSTTASAILRPSVPQVEITEMWEVPAREVPPPTESGDLGAELEPPRPAARPVSSERSHKTPSKAIRGKRVQVTSLGYGAAAEDRRPRFCVSGVASTSASSSAYATTRQASPKAATGANVRPRPSTAGVATASFAGTAAAAAAPPPHLAASSSLGSLAILSDAMSDGRPKTGLRLSRSSASLRPPRVLEPVVTGCFASRADERRREAWRTPATLEQLLSEANPPPPAKSILGGVVSSL